MAEHEAVWLHSRHEVTLVELVDCSGLSEKEVRELVEYGVLSPADEGEAQWRFSGECIGRVRRATRLRDDFELDTPALALAVGFLERIDTLEARIRDLSAQLQAPR
jgi:chaperone modulatory protein CbpM